MRLYSVGVRVLLLLEPINSVVMLRVAAIIVLVMFQHFPLSVIVSLWDALP